MQECPRCETRFNLLNIKDLNTIVDFPTQDIANFCPYCGVRLDSWDAWLDKEVLIIRPDCEDEVEVILKNINDWNTLDVYSENSGETFEIDSEFVFTPN